MAHLRDRRAFGNIGTRKFRGARFGDPLSPRFSGLLDQYGGAAAAYSLRALSSGWLAGDVVRARRVNTPGEANFTAGQVANGELATWALSGDAFVTTWYDQSGNANNAVQTTTTKQPKIVSAGALVVGGLDFDGVDDALVTASTVLGDTFTSAMVIQNDSTPTHGSFFSQHQGGVSNRFTFGESVVAPYDYRFFKQGLAPPFLDTTTGISSSDQLSFVVKSGVAVGMYIDGGANEGGNLGSSTVLGALLSIGAAEEGASGYGSFRASELILYNTDQTANRVGIETNINTAYSIF